MCPRYSTISETSAGVGSSTTRARWYGHEWILGVAVVAKGRMMLHIGRLSSWRNHGLLFHAHMARSMRRVIPARLFGLVGAPGLDFIVNGLMSSIQAATTSTAGQTPTAESDKKSNEQSTNDGADNSYNQCRPVDAPR